MEVPPISIVVAGIVPTAAGGVFVGSAFTVIATSWAAVAPSGSVAVIVATASPAATAVIVTVVPSRATSATASFELDAAYVSSSPSGSEKNPATSTVDVPPTSRVRAAIEPTAVGGLFVTLPRPTVTEKPCAAAAPSGSRAVIVRTAVPSATPVIVAFEPSIAIVAAASFELPAV